MSSDDNTNHEVARRIAKANGIPMPDERLPLFTASLALDSP